MAIYGYLWLSMAIYGYLVTPVAFHEKKKDVDLSQNKNWNPEKQVDLTIKTKDLTHQHTYG